MASHGSASMTQRQQAELHAAVIRALPEMDSDLAQGWIENPKGLAKVLREVLMPVEPTSSALASFDADQAKTDWLAFYKEVFGLDCDFSGLRIPERRPGFDRLIVVAHGLTAQQLFEKCKELFPAWKFSDAELSVASDRDPSNGQYAIWVRDRVEADEENKNWSADALAEAGVVGIALEERLVYELKYFKETGRHLDQNNATLCTGSRFSGGGVPSVRWDDDRLSVFRCGPDHSDDSLRAREVVSGPTAREA